MDKTADSELVSQLRAKANAEPVASFLSLELRELSPGRARVALKVRPEHMNFNGSLFGGIVMSIADQAMAFANNSVAFPSVASQFNIHFIAAAGVGDELIAECRVIKSGRRVGISEISVTNQRGKLIARATGTTIPVS